MKERKEDERKERQKRYKATITFPPYCTFLNRKQEWNDQLSNDDSVYGSYYIY